MQQWWKGAVTYQVYPRSFQDSDGDGVGDLKGISARLSHLADLGVDSLWLSPFFRSPMKDMGYDVSDYCGVNPLFDGADFTDADTTGADMTFTETTNAVGLVIPKDKASLKRFDRSAS